MYFIHFKLILFHCLQHNCIQFLTASHQQRYEMKTITSSNCCKVLNYKRYTIIKHLSSLSFYSLEIHIKDYPCFLIFTSKRKNMPEVLNSHQYIYECFKGNKTPLYISVFMLPNLNIHNRLNIQNSAGNYYIPAFGTAECMHQKNCPKNL